MDIISAPFGAPGGDAGASLRIWGIPIATVGQSQNFNGKSIAVYGGMSAGLPLANPAQQGLLVQGLISQAFGNWIGTNMTLDFIITPGSNAPGTAPGATTPDQSKTAAGTSAITPATPLNLAFNWLPNTPLSTAVSNTLKTGLPTFTVTANISNNLMNTTGTAIAGYFQNLRQFSDFLHERSVNIISSNPYGGTGYRGVQLFITGTTINVFDGQGPTAASGAKAIAFTDLVGQPVWRSGYLVQATVIMRGDLMVGQNVTLPQTQITIAGSLNFATPRDTSIFQGQFTIQQIRHVGNYKQPSGLAWVSILDLYTSSTTS